MKKNYLYLSLLFLMGCAGSVDGTASSEGRATILDDSYIDASGNDTENDAPVNGPSTEPSENNNPSGSDQDGSGGSGGDNSVPNETETVTSGTDQCMNSSDMAILGSDNDAFSDVLDSCFETCGELGNTNDCLGTCLTSNTEISAECAQCYNAMMNCIISTCSGVCNREDNDSECESCLSENCFTPFTSCSGIDPED